MDRLTNTLRIIIHAGLYLILLTPLIVWSRFRFPHLTGKVLAFQILVEIVASAAVIMFLIERDLKKHSADRPDFRFLSPLAVALIVFYVYSLISAFFGICFRDSFWGRVDRQDGLWLLLHFLLWFLVLIWFGRYASEHAGKAGAVGKSSKGAAHWWEQFDISRYVSASFWISAVVSLISIASWIIYDVWGISPGVIVTPGSDRAGGTFGNPFAIGPYLLFHFFYGLAYFKKVYDRDPSGGSAAGIIVPKTRRPKPSRFHLCAIILSQLLIIAAIVLSQTRGVILGLILGCLFLGTASIFNRSLSYRARVAVACVILIILIGSLGIWSLRNLPFVEESRILSRLTDISITETRSLQMRFLTWRSGLQGFHENPVFGWGHNNIYYVLNKFYNPEHVSFGSDFQSSEITWWDKSHNYYIDLLIEKGTVGFLFFLILIVILTRELWSLKIRFSALCTAAGFLSYGISNFVAFDSFGSLLGCFLMLGWVSVSAPSRSPVRTEHPAGSTKADRKKKRKPVTPIASATVLAVVAVLIVGCIGLFVNVKTGIANEKYNRARFFFQTDPAYGLNQYQSAFTHFSPYSIREKLNCAYLIANALITKKLDFGAGDSLGLALRLSKEAESSLPNDPMVYMVLNEIYNGLAIYVDDKYLVNAEAAGERALQLSPRRQEVMFNLGRTYVLAGKPEQAVELNRSMIRQFPDLPIAHWLLGLALIANDQKEEAKGAIEKALMIGYRFRSQEELTTAEQLFGSSEFNQLMQRAK